MAKQGKDGWINDAADLFSVEWQAGYAAYKDAYRVMAELRKGCEAKAKAELQANGLPESKGLVFGHKWGFAFKVVEADEAPKSKAPAKPKINLGEYMAAMAGEGRAH